MAAMGALQRSAEKQRQEIEGKAWDLARRLGAFTASTLASELAISRPAAREIINGWQAAGKVSILDAGNQRGRSRSWEVVPAHRSVRVYGILPPRPSDSLARDAPGK